MTGPEPSHDPQEDTTDSTDSTDSTGSTGSTGSPPDVAEPAELEVDPAGALRGGGGRYEKHLRDLAGLYRDQAAYREALGRDDGRPVYWVESSTLEQGPGALTVGTSTLAPGRVGEEWAMTRGHLHARAECAELYTCLAGRGVLLMETLDGRTRAVELAPGRAVHVPGHWVHRSVNTGEEPFTTLFCYPTDAGQDYGVIERAGGMRSLVVAAEGRGWALADNPDHRGYRASAGGAGGAP